MPFSTYTKAELHQLVADAGHPVVIKTAFIINGKIDLESDFEWRMYDGNYIYAQSMKDDLSNYDIVWTAFREQQPAPELNAASETSALTLKELNQLLMQDNRLSYGLFCPVMKASRQKKAGECTTEIFCVRQITQTIMILLISARNGLRTANRHYKIEGKVLIPLSQLFQNNLRHEPCSWSCAGSAENDLSPC